MNPSTETKMAFHHEPDNDLTEYERIEKESFHSSPLQELLEAEICPTCGQGDFELVMDERMIGADGNITMTAMLVCSHCKNIYGDQSL